MLYRYHFATIGVISENAVELEDVFEGKVPRPRKKFIIKMA